jgi:hypothetical protein
VRLVPPVRHPHHPPGRFPTLEQGEQIRAGGCGAFGYHPDPAVFEILRPARKTELQRSRAGPPAEADALNPAFYPRGKPGLTARYHGLVRGRGWHLGQLKEDLFMNGSRRTAVPHRVHGWPARPYTASDRS